MEDIKEYLKTLEGMDINILNGIVNYLEQIINLFEGNELVIQNLSSQIKKHFKGITIVTFDNDDFGRQSALSGYIELSDKLDDNNFMNTLLHELTHSLSINTGKSDYVIFDINRGLKSGAMDDFWWGINKDWVVDDNYLGIDSGNPLILFDEWVTEWFANKSSGGNFNEIKTDENGYFRLKTSCGYDGSNIMNIMELVYGTSTLVDLLMGVTLTEEERKKVIPLYGFHKMDEISKSVLTDEEKSILNPKYFQNPNNMCLLLTYMSEYCKADKYTDILIEMMNLLTRQLKVKIEKDLSSITNSKDLSKILNDIIVLEKSIIWHTDIEVLRHHEYFNNYEEIINMYINKVKEYEPISNIENIKKNPKDMLTFFESVSNNKNLGIVNS